jgi:hypothetical protein
MNLSVPAIDIKNLVHGHDRIKAVDGLTLQVRPRRCHGFFGRNGVVKKRLPCNAHSITSVRASVGCVFLE